MKQWLTRLGLGLLMVSQGVVAEQQKTPDEITFYFVRHGKTLLNTYDRVQGWVDSPLTEQGRETARYLGEGLKGIPFDVFYSSDAGRQRETLAIIIKQLDNPKAKIYEDVGLREVFFGGYEGDLNQVMAGGAAKVLGYKGGAAELFANMAAGTLSTQDSINAIAQSDPKKTAETYEQVKVRVDKALHHMTQQALKEGDKTVLAVSSGSSMQILISDLTDNPDKNKPLANATVVKIRYQNGQYHVDEIGSKQYIEQGMARLNNK